MKEQTKSVICLIMFLCLMILFTPQVNSNENINKISTSGYEIHDPIFINRNVDIEERDDFEGNGTPENPYIIENYFIEITGYWRSGIHIHETNFSFIIRDCYVISEFIGIRFGAQSVIGTAKIYNNTCVSSTGDGKGIYFGQLSSCHIENNTLTNFEQGIYLSSAHSCTIKNNIIKDNNCQGIYILHSYHNVIRDNLIKYNTEHGLAIVGVTSFNNSVVNNTFLDNAYVTSYTIDDGREGTIQSQAYDEGMENKWFDAEVELGNIWSNHAGEGVYQIDGPSQSVDEYPQSCRSEITTSSVFVAMIYIFITSAALLMLRKKIINKKFE